jgi:D-arabinose 1-dehydrogenase-like Zn-dependent alcohol dehydrogenase
MDAQRRSWTLTEVNKVLERLEAGKVRYRAVLTHA